jgi:3D (Asp-Asp-Asp) domain-containing protein
MLRRIAVIFFAALFLAHPSLTSVFADEALVVTPPSPSPATATPTATVKAATGTPSTDTHWTATPTSTATTPPTGSSTAIFLPATPTPRATRTARATPTARPAEVIPAENIYWVGTARVTMYTCVELGGCNYTASGLWPYEGIVAVDPRLIPLGATVWLDGLGIFLAADTGSLVYGNRVDVYVNDYHRAINWGVQERRAAAYIPP